MYSYTKRFKLYIYFFLEIVSMCLLKLRLIAVVDVFQNHF